ncbi:MAG: nucleotidyl transferase AbiEii/AbiGii toxin family protein [Nitrospira sp.]|nr:nucleotidyl transferase AbiEii/AbiGii toxin family protein [Nitrospira sp.]
MSSRGPNRAASIRARLLAKAKARGEDFNLVLTRFATERWLYRLSVSGHARDFLLKGAMLFDLWFDQPHRPTRDADFLGVGPADAGTLAIAVAEICAVEADDGLRYDAASIRVAEIRENASYSGLRVALVGLLGTAHCPMQIDVGFGDAVTPGPEEATFPTLLEDLPAPRLRVYPRETVIAEKLEAAVTLDMANSRMKDLFDLRMLAREGKTRPADVAKAIRATFQRRGTAIPAETPTVLTDAFARDPVKLRQWRLFLARNQLDGVTLEETIAEVRAFLDEPLRLARTGARNT